MNKSLKGAVEKIIKNNFIWNFLGPLSNIGVKIQHTRNKLISPPKETEVIEIPSFFESLTVLNGPFQGMRYPRCKSLGGAIFPKLMGSYEKEIQPYIKSFSRKNYSEIIDVGCAEGYYAVGMALACDNSKVYAYDTNPDAQTSCLEMAIHNDVEDRIEIRATFTPEMLKSFSFNGKGLIICDCEGYEKILFNESNLSNLRNCDLIIETHDCNDIEISTYLKSLLGRTHDIKSVYSVDDIQKALNYDYPQLEGLSLRDKKIVLREWRKSLMEWLICTPKIELNS